MDQRSFVGSNSAAAILCKSLESDHKHGIRFYTMPSPPCPLRDRRTDITPRPWVVAHLGLLRDCPALSPLGRVLNIAEPARTDKGGLLAGQIVDPMKDDFRNRATFIVSLVRSNPVQSTRVHSHVH